MTWVKLEPCSCVIRCPQHARLAKLIEIAQRVARVAQDGGCWNRRSCGKPYRCPPCEARVELDALAYELKHPKEEIR